MPIFTGETIPYPVFAANLFPREPIQQIIPFLGAGVSTSAAPESGSEPVPVQYPSLAQLTQFAETLNLTGPARTFFSVATLVSCHLQARQGHIVDESANDLMRKLIAAEYPPTATELAVLLSRLTNYSSLNEVVPRIVRNSPAEPAYQAQELLAALTMATTLTGVGWPPDALNTIAAYF